MLSRSLQIGRGALALITALATPTLAAAYEPYPVTSCDCAGQAYFADAPYCASYPPPVAKSALDFPITHYFMPRRAGCARHEYRYQVETPKPMSPFCGSGTCSCQHVCATCESLAPELLESFTPLEFERIGQIPNDSLLGAAVGPAR